MKKILDTSLETLYFTLLMWIMFSGFTIAYWGNMDKIADSFGEWDDKIILRDSSGKKIRDLENNSVSQIEIQQGEEEEE